MEVKETNSAAAKIATFKLISSSQTTKNIQRHWRVDVDTTKPKWATSKSPANRGSTDHRKPSLKAEGHPLV